jgi:restriction system protein
MALPTYQDFMRPLLVSISDGQEHRLRDLYMPLARGFNLTDDEINQKLPSGMQRVVDNRIAWARTYLIKAGLMTAPRRGHVAITELGRQALRDNPESITATYLENFDSFRVFRRDNNTREIESTASSEPEAEATPEEIIEGAHQQLRDQLSSDRLEKLKGADPHFFEKVVLQLLQAMGYGGVNGSGLLTPRSGDGGIDGVIYEDKLGLDNVCIQAKRWTNTVGRPTVQEFAGSMDMHRSKKGVILTTGRYSADALAYVDRIEGKKVVLIDGAKLCELMIEHRVGVTPKRNYELLDISEDFFDEDE